MMIQKIPVDRVLREAVATPYRDLVTRATGAAVRVSIEREIIAADCLTTLLDFSEVGLVDFSCADEVVAKLLLGQALPAGRHVVLWGVNEDHSEAIDHVLRRRDLAILVLGGEAEGLRVLGRLADDPAAAFREVRRAGPLDTSALAAALAWTLERAARALETLVLLRLLLAEDSTYRPVPTA
jgi:hypothetical protein